MRKIQDFKTLPKNKIRLKFNLGLIKDYCEKYKKLCKYFGLAGPKISDIIDWNDYIEEALTVEYDNQLIPDLIKNIQINKLESKIKYISGDIIELIISEDKRIKYPFDLINLDFLGTLIYQSDKSTRKKIDRIEVFKNLIINQADYLSNGEGFIFLITLNGQRGKEINVFETALKSLERLENKKQIEWLLSPKNNVRLYQKIAYVLPSLIIDCCKNLFDIKEFKLIIYQGYKPIMVHFSFFLIKNQKAHLDFSDINLNLLLNSQIILIGKNGQENEISSNELFSKEDPFHNYF